MAYWLEHRFIDHLHELDGAFVSPITNELMTLTDLQRGLALATLLSLPGDKQELNPLKFGHNQQHPISRRWLAERWGKPISQDTYANWVRAMTQAGVFRFTGEKGRNYQIEAGLALECELYQDQGLCDVKRHNPHWHKTTPTKRDTPSLKQSTPSPEPIREPAQPEETPPIHLDTNKANKSQQVTTNQKTLEREIEIEKTLPDNYLAWLRIRTENRGRDIPSPMDKAEADRCYELTGVDLEPGGSWESGIHPSPLTGSKQLTNN